MARPKRAALDQWLDQFSDWNYDEQRGALQLAAVLHRQVERAAKRGGNPNRQSAGELFDQGAARIAQEAEDAV
jgi:hypothetical protein